MTVFAKISSYSKHKKLKKNLQKITFIIFRNFSMFYQIFHSPQVKRWQIIKNEHGIFELLHELTNDLRLRILGKCQTLQNGNLVRRQPARKNFFCQYQQKGPKKQRINCPRGSLFHRKTRVSLKYFATDSLSKPFFDSKLSQTPSNLISLIILVTVKLFSSF